MPTWQSTYGSPRFARDDDDLKGAVVRAEAHPRDAPLHDEVGAFTKVRVRFGVTPMAEGAAHPSSVRRSAADVKARTFHSPSARHLGQSSTTRDASRPDSTSSSTWYGR